MVNDRSNELMIPCEDCDGVFQHTPGYEPCPCRLYKPHHAMCCKYGVPVILNRGDDAMLRELGITEGTDE